MSSQPTRRKKPWVTNTAVFTGLATVAVAVIVVFAVIANILLSRYSLTLSAYFSKFSSASNGNSAVNVTADEAMESARDLTREIEAEGAVLLENKNSTLPLKSGTKLNVFGFGSNEPVYGGSGSGSADESTNITLKDGLEDAGFTVNPDLWNFYAEKENSREEIDIHNLIGGDFSLPEPTIDSYPDDILQGASNYSSTAVYVVSRIGGEGGDEPLDMAEQQGGDEGKHYLELQDSELSILHYLEDSFDTVIVLVNSSHAMELGFLEDEGVDAALWVGGPGSTGFSAIGQILSGEVNPSGRTVDTYAYDLTKTPSYYNFGDAQYTNSEISWPWGFVYYEEGIYVGYRYFETRWIGEDTVYSAEEEQQYHDNVQYPFGYGLSYTTFDWKVTRTELGSTGGTVDIDVEVTNTGSLPGKDVVELYATAPYTPGGIEKSSETLQAFAKTDTLEPGQSQSLTLSFNVDDLASYDYTTNKAYVLDAGTYLFTLKTDAHTPKSGVEAINYTVDKTLVYSEDGDGPRSTDRVAATNHFDEVSFGDSNMRYLSRADFEGTMPRERRTSATASDTIVASLTNPEDPNRTGSLIDPEADPDVDAPTTGANNGLALADMVGVDYDDEKWELLLDQLSVSDLEELTTRSGWHTSEISSIGKGYYTEIDGPAGLNGLVDGLSSNQYPTEVVLASSWNTELAERFGSTYAVEALANGVSGLYAPAMNTHRSPFGGRNFEYYSEDGYLAGTIGAAAIRGIQSEGVYVYAKHYALNDQETNRNGVLTWVNEQALREIYLRPWEIATKEAQATGYMSGLNRIGTSWTGANRALMTSVPREEWGFQGTIITDGVPPYDMAAVQGGDAPQLPHYMDADYALRAGTDMMLTWSDAPVTERTTKSAYGLQVMREAVHRQLYKEANSNALTSRSALNHWWKIGWGVLDLALAAGLILIARLFVRRFRRPASSSIEVVDTPKKE